MTAVAPLSRSRGRLLAAGTGRGRPEIHRAQEPRATDGGATACLAMVLAAHGRHVSIGELGPRGGDPLRDLLEAADREGMSGSVIEIDPIDLRLLPRGAILTWETDRFVLFDGMTAEGRARIIDPEGRSTALSPTELDAFAGCAIVLEPRVDFEPRERERWPRGIGRLLRELRGERAVLTRVLIITLLLRVFALAVPLLTALVVDQVVPAADRKLLWIGALGVVFLVVFDALGAILRAHLLLHLRTRIDARMTRDLAQHLLSLPCAFFRGRQSGDLVERFGSGAAAREAATAGALAAVFDGCFAPIYAVVILCISLPLGLLLLSIAGFYAVLLLWGARRHAELVARDVDAQSAARTQLTELVAGAEAIRCAAAEEEALARWLPLHATALETALERGLLAAGLDTARRALEGLVPIGVLTLGALAVTGGELSLGAMLAVGALAGGFFGPLSALVFGLLRLQLAARHLERAQDVTAAKPERREPGNPAHRLAGAIAVRQLGFRYHDDAPLAVDGVSLDIPKGSLVALIGPSGSGRSTLAGLLAGMHRPASGGVYYDGRPLSELDLREVRRQIGVAPQQPFLFAASLRANLALRDPDADPSHVEAAARAAGNHDWILSTPMGYDTVLTDGGASLSGGERQRLGIARAILRRPPIVMLDQATSSLDAETERRILERLGQLGTTRILVTHHLASIARADLIVVLDRGRVVEYGRHRDLLARHGFYAALVAGRHPPAERPLLEMAS